MKEHRYSCRILIKSDKPLTRDDLIAMAAKLAETVGDGTIEAKCTYSKEVKCTYGEEV